MTACFGGYDPVRDLPAHGFDDAVLVTDDRDLVTSGWRVVYEDGSGDPRMDAKRAKMLPWEYTDCDAAVWLDASFEITSPGFADWTRAHLERADFTAWIHPERRIDITDEAEVSMTLPKYQGMRIREQAAHYKAEGFPDLWGLFACGTLGWVFTEETRALGEAWLEECRVWSPQDQISLPYLLWRTGMRFGTWSGNEYRNEFVRLRWDERRG